MKTKHLAFCVGLILVSVTSLKAQDTSGNRTDPVQELTKGFPQSVAVKNNGRLLEFCPDNTCNGFVTSGNVTAATLKDFAYLYVYFFSDFTYLEEWRHTDEAKKTAELLLAQPESRSCRNTDRREAARCVLRDLSRNGRIRLIFIRYDEGERSAVRENIAEKLSDKSAVPRP
jgi:hypothetical protein